MLNLASTLKEHSLRRPDKVALKLGAQNFTYGQLDAMSNQVAGFLTQKGIAQGDKIAISCPNLPFFPIVYYGILKAGAVVVPLNILLRTEEIAYHLQDSESKAYFLFEGTEQLPVGKMGKAAYDSVETCRELVVITVDPKAPNPICEGPTLGLALASHAPQFEMVATQPTDSAVILYTSGTTGRPKGAELTHFNMMMNAIACKNLLEGEKNFAVNQILLMVLPLFHSFGQTICMNTMFLGGGQVSMLPRFDPKQSLETIIQHQVSIFAGVPTMYWALLNEARSWPLDKIAAVKDTLQLCVSGGAAMPVELLKEFESLFDVPVMEGYGLSETSPVASFNHLNRRRKVGSIGEPIWGVEMQVKDGEGNSLPPGEVGEIVIRGHNVMKGYYKRPQATTDSIRDGWFHSGDMGKKDEDGYFFVVDRKKDMILRGGFNVYPRELEEVLITHPAVSLAAVIGVPHEEFGEEVKAYVVLKPDARSSAEEIISWSKEKMAGYKYPRIVEIRDQLPLGPTGKVLKRVLKEQEQGH